MKIEMIAVEDVVPYDRNPRDIGTESVTAVAKSIEQFGFRQPLVLDKNHVIVVGHTRFQAALMLGLDHVPCYVASELTEAQVQAYRLADNRTNENASWDDEKLTAELLAVMGEIDMTAFGFSDAELAALTASASADDALVDLSQADALALKWGCKEGKVWQVGPHRLMCGDSTRVADVSKLFGDLVPALMVTDPPYGVNYDAGWREGAGIGSTKRTGVVANDHVVDWTPAYKLFPGDVAYVWHAGKYTADVLGHLAGVGLALRSLVIWRKTSLVISRGHFHWQHEPCAYVVRPGVDSRWCGGSEQGSLWDIPNRVPAGEGETEHSTQKPIECMARAMRNHGAAGDVVYDPFCGSGTSIIAAHREWRRCLAMELTPGYCGVILERALNLLDVEISEVSHGAADGGENQSGAEGI